MSRVLPILFNTDTVCAILDGRKTVTRRCVKFIDGKNPNWTGYVKDGLMLYNGTNEPCIKPCQYQPGDILYVRETWSEWTDGYLYKAWTSPFPQPGKSSVMKWRPSIHMPKEAARIWLRVKDVRVERLQYITEEQAKAEGAKQCYEQINTIENRPVTYIAEDGNGYYILGFKSIWDSTIKKSDLDIYGWEANPWVWVIEFERCEAPEILN